MVKKEKKFCGIKKSKYFYFKTVLIIDIKQVLKVNQKMIFTIKLFAKNHVCLY